MIIETHVWSHGSRFTVREVRKERVRIPWAEYSINWSKPETGMDIPTIHWSRASRSIIVFGPDGKYCFANARPLKRWLNHFGLRYLTREIK